MYNLLKVFFIGFALVQQERHEYIFSDGKGGDQVIKLIDQSDLPAPENGCLGSVHGR